MNALPRNYRTLMLLSLALNLVLGTALVAIHWHHPDDAPSVAERRWARIPDPRQLARTLDEADRKVLNEVIEAHRGELGEHFRPLGHARRAVAEALRAEPFDPAAMQRAFEQMRSSESGTANAMHAFMLELATKVSPAGRQRIADHLQRGGGHHHEHQREQHQGAEREQATPPS